MSVIESINRNLNKRLILDCRCDARLNDTVFVVYYESIKRKLNKGLIFECRCDARLKAKAEGSTRLSYTRLSEEP